MKDDADLAQQVRTLTDRAEIIDCLARYARGMDRFDRALARAAYHDDAVDDHIGFVGPVDDFLDWAYGYHSGQVRHQHYVTNISVELAGDDAHVESYYLFIGTDRDEAAPLTITGGRYVDHFERRDGRWAIAARLCLVEWQTESTSLLNAAAYDFVARHGTIARDATDASYERPLVLRQP